jgi:probable HAF family extracellular repeat protein
VVVRRFALAGYAAAALMIGAAVAACGSYHGAAPANPRWTLRSLGSLGVGGGGATAINEQGQIVGYGAVKAIDPILGYHIEHAFLWQQGRMRDLGVAPPGYNAIDALAINERGQVLGASRRWEHPYLADTVVKSTAWLWEKGHVRTICTDRWGSGVASMNDEGQVIVGCSLGRGHHSYLWDNGRLTDLGTLGGKATWASDINDRGQIVGRSQVASGAEHAFLWQDGRMTDLGTLGGDSSWAQGINNRGQIVGGASSKGGPGSSSPHAVLWEHGTITDLGTTLANSDIVINGSGQIVWTARETPHVFMWEDGNRSDLGTIRGRLLNFVAITEGGRIVGNRELPGSTESSAFVWQGGIVTTLGSVGNHSFATATNERNEVVGEVRGKPVLWALKP